MGASKKVAILQSSYIPWRGYFDLINLVDEFVLLDDVQYTKRDWRSRNQIKTANGLQWLTVPVMVKGKFSQQIKDVVVSDQKWAIKHWNAIKLNYSKSKYFSDHEEFFAKLYQKASKLNHLSEINYLFIINICELLGINTRITWSMDYQVATNDKNQRLIDICKSLQADYYLSGPKAKSYLDKDLFMTNGIAVEYMNYENYPAYEQLYSGFEGAVSILDLIFNVGAANIKTYMKSFELNQLA